MNNLNINQKIESKRFLTPLLKLSDKDFIKSLGIKKIDFIRSYYSKFEYHSLYSLTVIKIK